MNAREQQLWSQLQALQIDDPSSTYNFTARLAKENGWKLSFARRVVEEYRRFLFLAGAAEHPVSPPDAIDQAWHLHLLYTRSYWDELCGRILGYPLHHEPTRGGRRETEKFGDWYGQTLASYERFFGAPPPRDIWPSPQALAKKESHFQRVNLSRFVLVPRLRFPQWLRRWTLAPAAALVLFGLPAGLFAAQSWNIFEWTGPEFLTLYLPLVAASLLLALAMRYVLLADSTIDRGSKDLTPDEAAYLAGGPQTALGAALGSLVRIGAIELRKMPTTAMGRQELYVGQPPAEPLPQLQQLILTQVKGYPGISIDALRRGLMFDIEPLRTALEERGLIYSKSALDMTRLVACAPLVLLATIGMAKIAIGIMRDKPVAILVVAVVGLGVAAFFAARRVFRTTAGENKLNALRQRHAELEMAAQGSLGTEGSTAPLSLAPSHLGLALGLFGFGLLAGGPGADLVGMFTSPRRQPDGTWYDNTAGSGCSTSGCSSSDGGGSSCGGSSCGGGGCGGCGGGGGD